jgi:predicted  nucleic acid-binding Zn-ribbon protein
VAKTSRERDQEARQVKLEHVREQVASGQLVIRDMSKAEQARWAKQHAASEARATPVERARRETAIANRRKRAARFSQG